MSRKQRKITKHNHRRKTWEKEQRRQKELEARLGGAVRYQKLPDGRFQRTCDLRVFLQQGFAPDGRRLRHRFTRRQLIEVSVLFEWARRLRVPFPEPNLPELALRLADEKLAPAYNLQRYSIQLELFQHFTLLSAEDFDDPERAHWLMRAVSYVVGAWLYDGRPRGLRLPRDFPADWVAALQGLLRRIVPERLWGEALKPGADLPDLAPMGAAILEWTSEDGEAFCQPSPDVPP